MNGGVRIVDLGIEHLVWPAPWSSQRIGSFRDDCLECFGCHEFLRSLIRLDDVYKLARMLFDAADIGNRHVRPGCDIINGAAEPVLDFSVAAPRPRSKALAKNFRWRRDRNQGDIGIDAAYRVKHPA